MLTPDHAAAYLSIQQVAQQTNTHPRTVRRWIAYGLPVAQPIPRGKLLIARSDLDAFLTSHTRRGDELEALAAKAFQELRENNNTNRVAREARCRRPRNRQKD